MISGITEFHGNRLKQFIFSNVFLVDGRARDARKGQGGSSPRAWRARPRAGGAGPGGGRAQAGVGER